MRPGGFLLIAAFLILIAMLAFGPASNIAFTDDGGDGREIPQSTPAGTSAAEPESTPDQSKYINRIPDPLGYENGAPVWWHKDPGPKTMTFSSGDDSFTLDTARVSDYIVNNTNEFRTSKDKGELENLAVLDSYARGWAEDMNQRRYYDHTDPNGENVYDWMPENMTRMNHGVCGYNTDNLNTYVTKYGRLKNYDMDTNETAGYELFTHWRDSEKGHREAMLEKNWDYVGVGIAESEQGNYATIIMLLCSGDGSIN